MPRTREQIRLQLLVLRCQAGDEAAFEKLYREFSDRTLRYLRGLLGEQSADDVHQEIWLTVHRKIASLHNASGFRTWLYQITRHRAIDQLRRFRKEAERYPEDLEAAAAPLESMPDGDPWAEGRSDVVAALDSLSREHRDVLILKYFEQMSYVEIALVVGCSVGTVRSRLHHAKLNARKAMAGLRP
jgi:RNA polymerase sigma-70 factor (ECF subfamily)